MRIRTLLAAIAVTWLLLIAAAPLAAGKTLYSRYVWLETYRDAFSITIWTDPETYRPLRIVYVQYWPPRVLYRQQ